MAKLPHVEYPCEELPEDPAQIRGLGLYEQRNGKFMQRIRVPGGRIEAAQLSGMAALAEGITPGVPLHLTTRQDVEFHHVEHDDVPALHRGLDELGISCEGACGDNVRNFTSDPGAGLLPGHPDVQPVAGAIEAAYATMDFLDDLPRKFKVSVSSSPEAQAGPWISDLGIIAQGPDAFSVVLAGSLGAKPGTGILYDESVSGRDLVSLAVAVFRLFHDEADRENRRRARLRHVRERLGDEAFVELVDEYREREGDWPAVQAAPSQDWQRVAVLHIPHGDIAVALARCIADWADEEGLALRIGLGHQVHVFGAGPAEVPGELVPYVAGPSIVSCTGAPLCPRGICQTERVEAYLRELDVDWPADLFVGISGCPNNCAHAAVADIGLVGASRRGGVEQFNVLVGGGRGRNPWLALDLAERVPAGAVPDMVARLVERYKEQARPDEAFAEYARREIDSLQEKFGEG
jgi:sulfite reductase (ferredoxin)